MSVPDNFDNSLWTGDMEDTFEEQEYLADRRFLIGMILLAALSCFLTTAMCFVISFVAQNGDSIDQALMWLIELPAYAWCAPPLLVILITIICVHWVRTKYKSKD